MDKVKARAESVLGDKWKARKWSSVIADAGKWLLEEEDRDEDDVVDTVAGLMIYGVSNERDLQNIAENKKDFTEKLSAEGVPKAICNLLFEKYVAGGTGAVASCSKRAWDNGGGDGKRQCISQNVDPTETLAEFIRVLPDAKMDDSESFLRFAGPLFGVVENSSIV